MLTRREKIILVSFLAGFFMLPLFCILDLPVNWAASKFGLNEFHLPAEIAIILAIVICSACILNINLAVWTKALLIVATVLGLAIQWLVLGVMGLVVGGLKELD